MRTVKWPKPEKRGPSPRKPIARRSRPGHRLPLALGDYRERVKYANDLWRHLIYAKEPSGMCPACHKRPWQHAAHGFIKGRHGVVRFDLDNGVPLCGVCHRIVDSDHHAKTELWTRYVGAEAYERLRLRTLGRGKVDIGLMILLLEQETERMKGLLDTWPVRPAAR